MHVRISSPPPPPPLPPGHLGRGRRTCHTQHVSRPSSGTHFQGGCMGSSADGCLTLSDVGAGSSKHLPPPPPPPPSHTLPFSIRVQQCMFKSCHVHPAGRHPVTCTTNSALHNASFVMRSDPPPPPPGGGLPIFQPILPHVLFILPRPPPRMSLEIEEDQIAVPHSLLVTITEWQAS